MYSHPRKNSNWLFFETLQNSNRKTPFYKKRRRILKPAQLKEFLSPSAKRCSIEAENSEKNSDKELIRIKRDCLNSNSCLHNAKDAQFWKTQFEENSDKLQIRNERGPLNSYNKKPAQFKPIQHNLKGIRAKYWFELSGHYCLTVTGESAGTDLTGCIW